MPGKIFDALQCRFVAVKLRLENKVTEETPAETMVPLYQSGTEYDTSLKDTSTWLHTLSA